MSSLDAAGCARRALVALARAADRTIAVDVIRSNSWASGVFVGEQVELGISAEDERWVADWLDALPKAEFVIPGYFVGDVVVGPSRLTGDERCCEILMLLIED